MDSLGRRYPYAAVGGRIRASSPIQWYFEYRQP